MADPTREQAIEACNACWDETTRSSQEWVRVFRGVKGAATLLTRDGKLRERLDRLLAEMITKAEQAEADGLPALAAAIERCADELEAALKEGEK